MEFRKREVKKVKNIAPNKKENIPKQHQEYSFDNKVIMISLICEVFEFEEIEKIANLTSLKFSNSGYNIENRIKSFVYPISEAKDIQHITSHWNSWVNKNSMNKKIKFSIRQVNNPSKEKVSAT
jgi:hypothetical protein